MHDRGNTSAILSTISTRVVGVDGTAEHQSEYPPESYWVHELQTAQTSQSSLSTFDGNHCVLLKPTEILGATLPQCYEIFLEERSPVGPRFMVAFKHAAHPRRLRSIRLGLRGGGIGPQTGS